MRGRQIRDGGPHDKFEPTVLFGFGFCKLEVYLMAVGGETFREMIQDAIKTNTISCS